MPPRSTTARRPRSALSAEQQRLYQLLKPYFAKASNAILACRDEGHWWWTDDARKLSFSVTHTGIWGIKEPCMREVDGEGCGVKRTRYVSPVNGLLEGPSAAYDYSGAPNYKLPIDPDTGYSLLSKEARALIRLERKSRKAFGEDTGRHKRPDRRA